MNGKSSKYREPSVICSLFLSLPFTSPAARPSLVPRPSLSTGLAPAGPRSLFANFVMHDLHFITVASACVLQGFTFLTGAAGVHAVGAAVSQRTGDDARCRHHAREVAAMEEQGITRGSFIFFISSLSSLSILSCTAFFYLVVIFSCQYCRALPCAGRGLGLGRGSADHDSALAVMDLWWIRF